LRVFATIFLTFSIFIQTFSTYIIKADFYLNRSYIAKNLCVNRDNPQMHCNGKCYLAKRIREQENPDRQSPTSKNDRFDVAPFFVPKPFKIEYTFSDRKSLFIIMNDGSLSTFHRSIFHPPSA